MALMKVTILLRSTDDPSHVLDEVIRMFEDSLSFDARLAEDGVSVSDVGISSGPRQMQRRGGVDNV